MAANIAQVGRRTMRIYALPLTRTPSSVGFQEHLTYYHFVTPPPNEDKGRNWTKWATSKASDIWAGFGQAPEGNWKRRVFLYGERLVDRIDFEELALKSVDPSLGPKLSRFGRSEAEVERPGAPTIPLIYPGSACSSPTAHLKSLLGKRTPRHRKGFWMWMIIAPFTAPFMIIPIIPNLPFFFCVWRSWSHYRAYKASSYLEQLIQKGAILPEENTDLDKIYAAYAPSHSQNPTSKTSNPNPDASSTVTSTLSSSSSLSSSSNTTSEKSESKTDAKTPPPLLLTRDAVPALTKLLEHPHGSSGFASEMYRALEQARLRLDRMGKS